MAQLRSSGNGIDSVCRPCQMQFAVLHKISAQEAKNKGLGITETVMDHSSGDLICTKCGLVLQERCIDESQEWRNFQSDGVGFGVEVNARMRGGDIDGVVDQYTGALRSTSFAAGVPGFEGMQMFQDMAEHNTVKLSPLEAALKKVSMKMKTVTVSLKLSESILQRCIEFMKYLSEKNQLGNKHVDAWYYAMIYLACREEGASRTLSELASSGSPDEGNEQVLMKQMAKKVKSLEKQDALGSQLRCAQIEYIDPKELMPRFVSKLQLSQAVCKPAIHIVCEQRRLRSLVNGPGMGSEQTQQCAVIASAIFIVAHLLELPVKPKLSDVAIAAKVPETSVRAAYEVLKSHQILLPGELLESSNRITLPPSLEPAARQPYVPASKAKGSAMAAPRERSRSRDGLRPLTGPTGGAASSRA